MLKRLMNLWFNRHGRDVMANLNSTFTGVLPGGIISSRWAFLGVGISKSPEKGRIHVSVLFPHNDDPLHLRPTIEALMAMYCQQCGNGFEAALEELCAGATKAATKLQTTQNT